MEHERAARRLLDALTRLDFEGVRIKPRLEWMLDEHGVTDNEERYDKMRTRPPVAWVRLVCRYGDREVDVHNPAFLWDLADFADRTAKNLILVLRTTGAETAEEMRRRLQLYEAVDDHGLGRTIVIKAGLRALPEPLLSEDRISIETARSVLRGRSLARSGLGQLF